MGIGILFEDVKVDTKTSEVTVRSEWQPGFMDVMAVGRNGLTDDLRNRMEDQAAVGRLAAAEWTDLTASLSEADCWDLLRGFVTLETQLGWRGGSVAAGNLLGRAFVQRFPHRWQEAVVWLRGHAKGNPWYFTKHSPLSFDSAEEWHRFIAADRQRQEQTALANAERKALRIAEARQNHQQRLEHQREKQTQRRQAIDKLANVSPVERLCEVAWVLGATRLLSYPITATSN